ncbi:hypothetical protein NFI96_020052 [Prochilodus magdalenae]|nr:hypothetical protein NFI96_020052 [Prochilodus magdalenae]
MFCFFFSSSSIFSHTGDLSMGDLQDPFLVSIHIIADPGQARTLQRAADQVLSWLHPELTLFRVSERAVAPPRRSKVRLQHPTDAPSPQPALAVILFLQEEYGGKETRERLHGLLRQSPWCYHHTESVNGRGVLPLLSDSQDFFTLAPGTPLWALRHVHYGKEIVRFTIYCQHETYSEQVQLYRLLLRRRLAQRKEDFCFCVVYSNHDTEIQLSFKRLPRGQKPILTECAIMEIRVRDVGGLVPLLPHPCTPISDIRWQTEDYDGNRILLQVQGSWKHHRHTIAHISHMPSPPSSEHPSSSSCYGRGPASYRNRRYRTSSSSHSRSQKTVSPCTRASQTSLPLLCEQDDPEVIQNSPEDGVPGWMGRSRSTFSLPAEGLGSVCASPSAPRPRSLSSFAAPVFRINVDALVGAEETDVDTGQAVDSSSVDLSVVSAYSRPPMFRHSEAHVPRPVSAPPQDRGPDFTVLSDNETYFSLKRHPIPPRTCIVSSKSTPCAVQGPFSKKASTSQDQILAGRDAEQRQSNGTAITDVCRDGTEEDEQEFYI